MLQKSWVFIMAAGLCALVAGGCDKFAKGSDGVSQSAVVATVGGKNITFADWMRQVDLLRIITREGRGLDPNNGQQVAQALETLVDQEVVLAALRKANYADPKFDQTVQNQLVQADLQLKEDRDQLERDLKAVQRLENNYKDALKEYLLAQNFASTQKNSVVVTEKEIKDRYDQLSQRYKQAGQKIAPYDKNVRALLMAQLQSAKLMRALMAGTQVVRKDDVIKKYLTSLSPSRETLAAGAAPASSSAPELKKK
jgi:hypothetical protein